MKKTDTLISNTEASVVPNRVLFFSPDAANDLLNKVIGWGRFDYPDNKKEQGGWLIGSHTMNSCGEIIKSDVRYILQAETDIREPGYIEWSALEDIRLQRSFFQIRQNLAKTDPELSQRLELLGWWHTHPNKLHVFLSGTDRTTIADKFNKPGHYSVVLNPHRKTWRVFAGPEATEILGIMLLSEGQKPDKEKKKGKGNWKKRKNRIHQKKQKRKG